MALYRLIWKRFIQCVWMPVVFVAALIFVGVYLFLSFQTDSYQMIFFISQAGTLMNLYGLVGFVLFLFLSYEFIQKGKQLELFETVDSLSGGTLKSTGAHLLVMFTASFIYFLAVFAALNILLFAKYSPPLDFYTNFLLSSILYLLLPTLTGLLLGSAFSHYVKRLPFYFIALILTFLVSDFSDYLLMVCGYYLGSIVSIPAGVLFIKLTGLFHSMLAMKVANVDDAYGMGIELFRWALFVFWAGLCLFFLARKLLRKQKFSRIMALILSGCLVFIGLLQSIATTDVFDTGVYQNITHAVTGEDYYYETLGNAALNFDKKAEFQISEYDLNFFLSKELKASAILTLKGGILPSYEFTLYHGFSIISITDEAGNPLPYTREGDYFKIENANEENLSKIQIRYQGSHQNYYSNYQGAYLPGFFPYYPIEGQHTVYEDGHFCTESFSDNLKQFRVDVSSIHPAFSNLERTGGNRFQGHAKSLTLVAGMYEEKEIEGVTHIYPESRIIDESVFNTVKQSLKHLSATTGLPLHLPEMDYVFHSPNIMLPVPFAGPQSVYLDKTLLYYNIPIHPNPERWLTEQLIEECLPDNPQKQTVRSALIGMAKSILNGDDTAQSEFLSLFGKPGEEYIHVPSLPDEKNREREIQYYIYKALLGSDVKTIFRAVDAYLKDSSDTMDELVFAKALAEQSPIEEAVT